MFVGSQLARHSQKNNKCLEQCRSRRKRQATAPTAPLQAGQASLWHLPALTVLVRALELLSTISDA